MTQNTHKTAGQLAYEEDCRRMPTYRGNGKTTPRPQWEDLPSYAKWSWEKNPTPREWKQQETKSLRHVQEGTLVRVYWGILPVACSSSERAAIGWIEKNDTEENRAGWRKQEEDYKDNLDWVFHILKDEGEKSREG